MGSTCGNEILDTAKELFKRKGINDFKIAEVINLMKLNRTEYEESTIRTHISSKCYKNAPHNHAKHYDDFERIEDATYKLLGY